MVIARELYIIGPKEGFMDAKYKVLTESEIKGVLIAQDHYTLAKNAIAKSIDEYMAFVANSPPNAKKIIQKRDSLQLEVFYCDETIIVDCSKFSKVDGQFYACIEAFRERKGFITDPNASKYEQIGKSFYSDGNYLYELEEGKMMFTGVGLISGINNLIFGLLLHLFD